MFEGWLAQIKLTRGMLAVIAGAHGVDLPNLQDRKAIDTQLRALMAASRQHAAVRKRVAAGGKLTASAP